MIGDGVRINKIVYDEEDFSDDDGDLAERRRGEETWHRSGPSASYG